MCGKDAIYWSPQHSWLHRNPALDDHPVKHGVLCDPLLISKLAAAKREAVVIEEAKPIAVYTPEVYARDATDDETPGGCRIVLNAAKRAGWTVHSLHYARGPMYHGTSGEFLRMVDSIVLRLDRNYRRVVATWEDGKFHTAWNLNPLRKLNATQLKDIVKDMTEMEN